MQKPKISVVLPVFNAEKYIEKSIKSILFQGYHNFEFLICDDGSTDKSLEIINSNRDFRTKVFRNKNNRGLFETLNILIKKSKGNYIRLWSQDDVMKQNCLEEEVIFFNKYPQIALSYCARDKIDSRGKLISKAPLDKTPDVIMPSLAAQIMFYHGSITGNISTVMIRKKVLEEVGLFRQDMRVSADFEMWARITEKYPIGFIRKPLIKLRSHKQQFSRSKGVGILFMRENREIFANLSKRLPSEIKQYAKKYVKHYNNIYNFHYLVKSFLSGNFVLAKKAYKEIHNPGFAFGKWLITLNGRFLRRKPKFFING